MPRPFAGILRPKQSRYVLDMHRADKDIQPIFQTLPTSLSTSSINNIINIVDWHQQLPNEENDLVT